VDGGWQQKGDGKDGRKAHGRSRCWGARQKHRIFQRYSPTVTAKLPIYDAKMTDQRPAAPVPASTASGFAPMAAKAMRVTRLTQSGAIV
jgi:hypothetical protein